MHNFDIPSLLKAAQCFGYRRPKMTYVAIIQALQPLLEGIDATGREIDPKAVRNAIDEGRMGAANERFCAGVQIVGDFGMAAEAQRARQADVRVRNHTRLGGIANPVDLTGAARSAAWYDGPRTPPKKRARASR